MGVKSLSGGSVGESDVQKLLRERDLSSRRLEALLFGAFGGRSGEEQWGASTPLIGSVALTPPRACSGPVECARSELPI